MQSVNRPESPLKALFSVQVLLAVVAVIAYYSTIIVPDRALLLEISPEEKPGINSGEVIKEAKQLKPWKLLERNNLVGAVQEAQGMLRARPNDVAASYCAAMVFKRSGNINDAYTQMRIALNLAPRNNELRLEYARMLLDTGKVDDSIAQFKQVIHQSPKAIAPRMELAQVYLNSDRPADCATELEALLQQFPNNVIAHKLRGIALARSGRAQDGMDEYLAGTVTEHGEGHSQAVNLLLGFYGDLDKAKYALEQQSERSPDDPIAKLHLAEICLYADKPADAKNYLIEARKLSPYNPEIQRSLCIAYKRLGDNRQALTAFMQSVALEQEQAKRNQHTSSGK